ncbi:hypothetical protein ACFV2X_22780 [Streptomyces sp. NPDC059679]|uniref:hypothetical protein n=1 Tax=Streptomyces sp. NPDC059679 TaxID=3346903 RepID=UPI0036A3FD81
MGSRGHRFAFSVSARATKAGYRTQGDSLDVFAPAWRPGTDYVALGILLAEDSTLRRD